MSKKFKFRVTRSAPPMSGIAAYKTWAPHPSLPPAFAEATINRRVFIEQERRARMHNCKPLCRP